MQQFGRSRIGNRTLPALNKRSEEKWITHCQAVHQNHLRGIQSSVDNKWGEKRNGVHDLKQATYSHLRHNLKRAQLEDERFSSIERENRILLEKMSAIMQQSPYPKDFMTIEFRPGVRLNQNQYPMMDTCISQRTNLPGNAIEPRSLNNGLRRRELERITQENLAIVKRIQNREPNYDHLQWDRERAQNEIYLSNICEFPYTLSATSTMLVPQTRGPYYRRPHRLVPLATKTDDMGKSPKKKRARKIEIVSEPTFDLPEGDIMLPPGEYSICGPGSEVSSTFLLGDAVQITLEKADDDSGTFFVDFAAFQ